MTRWGHLFTACRKKATLTCHAERERSIWSHQAGGVAHLGFFAALRMTCPGHFFMACHMLAPSAGLPDSSYTTRHRRPPARGGPTIDDRLWRGTSRPSIVGPPLAGGLRCRPVTGSQHTACYAPSTFQTTMV